MKNKKGINLSNEVMRKIDNIIVSYDGTFKELEAVVPKDIPNETRINILRFHAMRLSDIYMMRNRTEAAAKVMNDLQKFEKEMRR